MTAYDFDLFIIGSGSGGGRAGRVAGEYGKKVAYADLWHERHATFPRKALPLSIT